MNTEVYDTRIVSDDYMAYTMSSGHTLYVEEYIPGDGRAYTLAQPDGQGLTWNKADSKDEPWVDGIISNAVNRETNLNRVAQLLNMYGIESHWCNHVQTPPAIEETTMNVVVPTDSGNRLPDHLHIIKESPLGLTWVHTYTLTDRVRATDHDAAMRLIEDMPGETETRQ